VVQKSRAPDYAKSCEFNWEAAARHPQEVSMYRRMAIFSRSATAVLFATLCFSGNTVRAQQSAQKGNAQTQAQAKENPFSGAEDKKLMVFAGAWQEDVRYAGDPADSPSGKGRWIARPAYGLYLVIGYEGNGPEGDSHAHGVMAYDHEDRVYKLWWFDDAGGIGEYSGNWKDDNTLVLEHKKTAGGRPFRERITYTHVSDDEVHTRIEQAWGTEAYKVYLDASAQRAQLTEGKGWGEKLSQQGRRGRLGRQPDSQPPAKKPN